MEQRGTHERVGLTMGAPAQRGSSPLVINRVFVLLVVGFGLFKAVIDQAYSSALFTARSAYPIINSVEFSIAASFAVLGVCVVVMAVGWRRPMATLRPAGIACMLLLLITDCASAFGLLGGLPPTVVGTVLPVVYGLAAVVSNAAWLVPIASVSARECLAALACSYLLAKVMSEIVVVVPLPAAAWAMLALGLASVGVFCASPVRQATRLMPTRDEMAEKPTVVAHEVVINLAGPLAVFVVLNTVLGLIMAFQVTGAQAVDGSSFLKAVASGAANLLLLGIALFAKGTPNIRRAFGLLFPVVALLLMALPFMDHVYGALFGVLLMFLQGIVSTMVLFMLLEAAKRWGVPVIAMVAAISFVSRAFVLVGVLVGGVLGVDTHLDDTVRALIVVVVALYVLALALVWLLRGRTSARGDASVSLGAELSTFDELDGVRETEECVGQSVGEAAGDPLAERAQELALAYHLTAREAEVALLLARGRSAAYIAETLNISPHTVRGYIKDAYVKLGVHAKQELIDRYSGGR